MEHYLESAELIPRPQTLFTAVPNLPIVFYLLFSDKCFYEFLISAMRAICLVHLCIILIIPSEKEVPT